MSPVVAWAKEKEQFDKSYYIGRKRQKNITLGGGKNMDDRKRMGEDKAGVIFPIAPNISEMGETYMKFIDLQSGLPSIADIEKEIE